MSSPFTQGNCTELGDFTLDSNAILYCNRSEVKSLCLNACQILSCDELDDPEATPLDWFFDISVKLLTFFLLGGFAATVDTRLFFINFKDKGVYLGLFCQFLMMPFLGFLTLIIFGSQLDLFISIMIILVTSCPGGAYSNWFCSMFNADLSLSVAMTTTSTFMALFMLPLNVFIYLFLYQSLFYNQHDEDANNIVSQIPYKDLFITLFTVICGVVSGLVFGYFVSNAWKRRANIVGNVAGVLLQFLALFASSTSCSPPWDQNIYVFIATFMPLFFGMLFTFLITSKFKLPKPQRMAIVIEAGYQNIGIAAAVALSLGSKGRSAVVVSILYGTFQAFMFISFCLACVFYGWTLAPPNTKIFRLLFDDFQGYIAVHDHYKTWRLKHPDLLDSFTEEEKEKMKQRLGYIDLKEDKNSADEEENELKLSEEQDKESLITV